MSSGKNIEIRIAATGGDQAAAEVKKLTTSVVAADQKTVDLSHSQNKVTDSSVRMRMGIQNAAFQFQDMAVQAEMGTSAVRIFSQQVPQLLGGMGAAGAIAGAVIGIGVPLAAALFAGGKEAKDATPKIDALKESLEELKTAQEDAEKAKRVESAGQWLAALDDEEEYYQKLNAQLARHLEYLTKIRALKEGADSAEREERIAAIEADPSKSKEVKIAEIAAIREEEAAAKTASKKQALEDAATRDAVVAQDLQEKSKRQADDLETTRKAREDAEAKAADLEARVKTGSEAGLKLPDLEAGLRNMELTRGMQQAGGNAGDQSALNARIAAARKEIEDAKKAAAEVAKNSKELGLTRADLEKLKSGESDQSKQAAAARTEAENAHGKSLYSEAMVRSGLPEIDRQAEAEKAARQRRTTAAMIAARKAEREEQEREAEKAAREAAKKRVEESESSLDGAARSKGLGMRKFGLARSNETVAAVGKALQDGTDANELQRLGDMIREAQGKNGAAITNMLLQIISGFQEQAKDIETMKRQLRNKP